MPVQTLDHQRASPSLLKRSAPVGVVALALLLAVVIINPFREMVAQDDAWAYARMVQHTLATGKYKIDPFTVVNLPVQIYLAAGIAKIFGYSLVLLRFIELAFAALAFGSFYLLLREFGHTRQFAAFITLVLLASPTVLILSFAFMTDIQSLAWILLALLLYVRGLRSQSAWLMFLGSLAAGCAIGTRQFSMAIVAGLALSWLLSGRVGRPRLGLVLAGFIVPFMAAVAQVYIGITQPDFTQSQSMVEMHAFYHSGILILLEELFWRCAIITQYLGMALLPLLPLSLAVPRSFWRERLGRVPVWVWGLLGCVVIVVALSLCSFHSARPLARHRGFWVPLELHWVLPVNFEHVRPVMRALDLVGILGGGVLTVLALHWLRSRPALQSLRPEVLLLGCTGFSLLLLHLPFNQLNDTYIVGFLPFILLWMADILRPGVPKRFLQASVAFSIVLILLLALWERGEYAWQQAAWSSANALYDSGIQPANMSASLHWELYHGAFDDWIAAGHRDSFYDWFAARSSRAQYRIAQFPSLAPPPGWRLLASRSYRNAAFKRRYILTLERDSSTP
jgi:4-amino-4-deoxy-L-arabinose transferase-like glycosyltransferase